MTSEFNAHDRVKVVTYLPENGKSPQPTAVALIVGHTGTVDSLVGPYIEVYLDSEEAGVLGINPWLFLPAELEKI